MSKYIELYSGNRNRNIYPLPASYEVPFAATFHCKTPNQSYDTVTDGAIYYKFTLYPQNEDYAIVGTFQSGTTNFSLYLDPTMNDSYGTSPYNLTPNYYKGYTIISNGQERIIRSYNPSTGNASVDQPFALISPGDTYTLYQAFPTQNNYLYIPTVDDNNNIIQSGELAYNGYYIVFESDNPNYSNNFNSNIFYRKISYYDFNYQVAYYDEPIPFFYDSVNDPPQTFTLRKSLPTERWTLPVTTYLNTIPPSIENKFSGPLVGPIITLPEGASNVDNYYTGKYVYFYSNIPETYSNIYPSPTESIEPISNIVFYPVYGYYYIKAYNGKTKQLSVCYDRSKTQDVQLPSYNGIGYNIYYFRSVSGASFSKFLDYCRVKLVNFVAPFEAVIELDPNYFIAGKTYNFKWILQDISVGPETTPTYFEILDNGNPIYTSDEIPLSYLKTFVFSITPTTTNITFVFHFDPTPPSPLPGELYAVKMTYLNIQGIGYNSSSFTPVSGISSITNVNDEYKASFDNNLPYIGSLALDLPLTPVNDKFNICWCLKSTGNFNTPVYFIVSDNGNPIYTSPPITSTYSYISFSITPTTSNVTFEFYYDPVNPLDPHSVCWKYFFVLDETIQSNENDNYNYFITSGNPIGMNIINIVSFDKDNFNPLMYNGTMVSVNQTTCYRINLLSITLPNAPLRTGSRIAFYPYVYVEFSNATAPNNASGQIIYSNNPNSNRALFIAPVTQLLQPTAKTFITLSGGGMSQLVKFKPNDNLRFSVYLPDGSLFQTLDIDTLPPYEPQLGLQIDAVFSITRADQSSIQGMLS
jgi:hypothetical protein